MKRPRLWIALCFFATPASIHAQNPNCLGPSNEPLVQAIRDGEIDLNAGHDPDDWEVYFLEVRGTTKGGLGGGARK